MRKVLGNIKEAINYLVAGRFDLIFAGVAGWKAGIRGEIGPSGSLYASPISGGMMKQVKINNHSSSANAISLLAIFSVLSPIAGLLLEIVLAWRFGSAGVVDAYRICIMDFGIWKSIIFGQMLPHIVIPLFSEYRAKNSEQEGWRLTFTLATGLGVASIAFIFFYLALSEWIG